MNKKSFPLFMFAIVLWTATPTVIAMAQDGEEQDKQQVLYPAISTLSSSCNKDENLTEKKIVTPVLPHKKSLDSEKSNIKALRKDLLTIWRKLARAYAGTDNKKKEEQLIHNMIYLLDNAHTRGIIFENDIYPTKYKRKGQDMHFDPLHRAIILRNKQLVSALLKHKLDPYKKSKKIKNAYQKSLDQVIANKETENFSESLEIFLLLSKPENSVDFLDDLLK